MNAAVSGLGASIDPRALSEPIDFYSVTDGLYYRHAGSGRCFRLTMDRDKIAAANSSTVNDAEEAGRELDGSTSYQEVPIDLVAHRLSQPIADWRLGEHLGDATLADLAFDIVDEIDEHVDAHPLPLPAPAIIPEAVVSLSSEVVLTVLQAVEPVTSGELVDVLRGRGVLAGESAVAEALSMLHLQDDVESDTVSPLSSTRWTTSPRGRDRAGQLREAFTAIAAA